jgi:transmembrane sensor
LPYLGVSETYTTGIGEQRSFKLADGSTLHLNVMSRAKVKFSGQLRRVQLLEGEALFVVRSDAQRPFQVTTDTAAVQVLGTQFNVNRQHGRTTVSVLDGAVRAGNESASEELGAGEEASVTLERVERNPEPDTANAVAWRQRRLVFRDDTLAEVVAEFNRYNAAQIRVEGKARDKQLIGIFNADDPQSLMLFLGRDGSLDIERDAKGFAIRPQ